jgi:hypothetical protein
VPSTGLQLPIAALRQLIASKRFLREAFGFRSRSWTRLGLRGSGIYCWLQAACPVPSWTALAGRLYGCTFDGGSGGSTAAGRLTLAHMSGVSPGSAGCFRKQFSTFECPSVTLIYIYTPPDSTRTCSPAPTALALDAALCCIETSECIVATVRLSLF